MTNPLLALLAPTGEVPAKIVPLRSLVLLTDRFPLLTANCTPDPEAANEGPTRVPLLVLLVPGGSLVLVMLVIVPMRWEGTIVPLRVLLAVKAVAAAVVAAAIEIVVSGWH